VKRWRSQKKFSLPLPGGVIGYRVALLGGRRIERPPSREAETLPYRCIRPSNRGSETLKTASNFSLVPCSIRQPSLTQFQTKLRWWASTKLNRSHSDDPFIRSYALERRNVAGACSGQIRCVQDKRSVGCASHRFKSQFPAEIFPARGGFLASVLQEPN